VIDEVWFSASDWKMERDWADLLAHLKGMGPRRLVSEYSDFFDPNPNPHPNLYRLGLRD
jgi:hypothetical protein